MLMTSKLLLFYASIKLWEWISHHDPNIVRQHSRIVLFPFQPKKVKQTQYLILFPIFLKLAPSLHKAIPLSKHSSVTCSKKYKWSHCLNNISGESKSEKKTQLLIYYIINIEGYASFFDKNGKAGISCWCITS